MDIITKKLVILPKVLHFNSSKLFLFALAGLAIAFFIGFIVHEIRDLKNYTLIFLIMYILCEITLSGVRSFPYRIVFLKVGGVIFGAALGFFLSLIATWLFPKKH